MVVVWASVSRDLSSSDYKSTHESRLVAAGGLRHYEGDDVRSIPKVDPANVMGIRLNEGETFGAIFLPGVVCNEVNRVPALEGWLAIGNLRIAELIQPKHRKVMNVANPRGLRTRGDLKGVPYITGVDIGSVPKE